MRPGEGLPEPPGGRGIGPVAGVPRSELPIAGTLEIPGGDYEGPPNGLTIDAAIEYMVRNNLDLRAKAAEIPKAEADILTASLRANPLLYADTQFIPYGSFSEQRPGGPTQYDLNITQPLDLSHKRRARTEVASRAKKVTEAQYQDAVRQAIDNLATAFVDVLAARETLRFSRASLTGLGETLRTARGLAELNISSTALTDIEVQRETAEVAVLEAEESLKDATRALATLLNLPPAAAETLEVRGSLHTLHPEAPPADALIRMALEGRPDIVAFRLGVRRAEAEVQLARANRLEDVFLLVQPYTFQDNSPSGLKSAHSAAVGVTIPLPLFNRNQGNIQRARITVGQTMTELAELERRVVAEVQRAERAYQVTHAAEQRFEGGILDKARQSRDTTFRLYTEGEADFDAFLNAQRRYNEVVRQYRDTLVRHRRSMLQINTAVGRRIFP
jgi:cobalt-zinc-cadmium efflux system outer membrane protein